MSEYKYYEQLNDRKINILEDLFEQIREKTPLCKSIKLSLKTQI